MECLPLRADPAALFPRLDPFIHVVDDLLDRGPRREHPVDPLFHELRDVVVRDDPAAEEHHVAHLLLAEELDDPRKQVVVRPGEDRQADTVDVLLRRRAHDHFGRLVQTRVDDLHTGVAKGARDDLRPPVVTVEPRFPDEDTDFPDRFLRGCRRHALNLCRRHRSSSSIFRSQNIAGSVYTPIVSRRVSHISPRVTYSRAASTRRGIRFTFGVRDPSFSADRHARAFLASRLRRTSFVRATCCFSTRSSIFSRGIGVSSCDWYALRPTIRFVPASTSRWKWKAASATSR